MNRGAYRRQGQQLVLPEPDQVGALLIRTAGNFARRNKIITGSYLIGLLILMLGTTGTQLTLQQAKEYDRIMSTIDVDLEYAASSDYWNAKHAYRASQGWFWSCSDSLCRRNRDRMMQAERRLNEIRQEGEARMSDAKKVAGLFSEVGVNEVKDSFWTAFHSGKRFAQRQSMWDAMFIGIRQMTRGRDESMAEYALKVLIQVLINFSMGLLMALIVFVFGLWSVVRSYQPDPLTAVVFFVGASLAGMAFVVTYLAGVFGAAAAGVYGIAKVAESAGQNRIRQGQRGQQYMGHRPHYD